MWLWIDVYLDPERTIIGSSTKSRYLKNTWHITPRTGGRESLKIGALIPQRYLLCDFSNKNITQKP